MVSQPVLWFTTLENNQYVSVKFVLLTFSIIGLKLMCDGKTSLAVLHCSVARRNLEFEIRYNPQGIKNIIVFAMFLFYYIVKKKSFV